MIKCPKTEKNVSKGLNTKSFWSLKNINIHLVEITENDYFALEINVKTSLAIELEKLLNNNHQINLFSIFDRVIIKREIKVYKIK